VIALIKHSGVKYQLTSMGTIIETDSLGETANQFLIVADPVGDEPVAYKLYFWNEKNTVPGKDNVEAGNNVKALCIIPPPASAPTAKAEGIAFVEKKMIPTDLLSSTMAWKMVSPRCSVVPHELKVGGWG
jgi:hypothetical protein